MRCNSMNVNGAAVMELKGIVKVDHIFNTVTDSIFAYYMYMYFT